MHTEVMSGWINDKIPQIATLRTMLHGAKADRADWLAGMLATLEDHVFELILDRKRQQIREEWMHREMQRIREMQAAQPVSAPATPSVSNAEHEAADDSDTRSDSFLWTVKA